MLWHDGFPTDAPSLYEAFYRTLELLDDGRLRARCQGETCWIVPLDTAFVVDSVDVEPESAPPGKADSIELLLTGGVREALDPTTLSVGADNVLYARVRKGDFPARFSRKAYYQIARHIVERDGGFALQLGDRFFPVAGASPA